MHKNSRHHHHHHHNLDISTYSYDDILNLFQIPVSKGHTLSREEMTRAKKVVARTHPDMSGLADHYFVFYREAFHLLTSFYHSQNRHALRADERNAVYYDDHLHTGDDDEPGCSGGGGGGKKKKRMLSLEKLEPEKFNRLFHELFDQHMKVPVSEQKRKELQRTRDWWYQDDHDNDDHDDHDVAVNSVHDIHRSVEKMRSRRKGARQQHQQQQQQQQQQLMHGRQGGLEELQSRYGIGELYDDDDNDDHDNDDQNDHNQDTGSGGGRRRKSSYISSDVFGAKLRFEDVRRVHRDETIFCDVVVDGPADNTRFRQTVEGLKHSRKADDQNSKPLSQDRAEKMLLDEEVLFRRKITKREFGDKLNTLRFEEKNKHVLARFLAISNG